MINVKSPLPEDSDRLNVIWIIFIVITVLSVLFLTNLFSIVWVSAESANKTPEPPGLTPILPPPLILGAGGGCGYDVDSGTTSKDNTIIKTNCNNYGTVELIELYDKTTSQRGLIEYDLTSLLAEPIVVVDATLELYYFGWGGTLNPQNKKIYAYKLIRDDWSESISSWCEINATDNWTNPGGDYVTSDPDGVYSVVPAGYSWMEWDITDLVSDAISNNTNLELLLRFEIEDLGANYSWIDFRSKEYSNPDYRPIIEICYYVIDCPDVLQLTNLGAQTISANWSIVTGNYTGYMLRYKLNDYPETIEDGELAYQGIYNSANVSGLSLEISKYCFSLWFYVGDDFSDCYTTNSIGGEGMLNAVYLILPWGVALILIVISFIQKSVLIKLAIICCMWACFMQEEIKDTWLQSACIIIIIWCVISIIYRIGKSSSNTGALS